MQPGWRLIISKLPIFIGSMGLVFLAGLIGGRYMGMTESMAAIPGKKESKTSLWIKGTPWEEKGRHNTFPYDCFEGYSLYLKETCYANGTGIGVCDLPEKEIHGRNRNKGIHIWEGGSPMPLSHLETTIKRTAKYLGINPSKCVRALLEICAVESDFGVFVKQKRGPALSPWQIEPATWDGLIKDIEDKYPEQYARLCELYDNKKSELWNRSRNIPYACASAMLYLKLYYPGGYSRLVSLEQRAKMWKRWYNTPKGKGTIAAYYIKTKEHIGSIKDS